MLTGELRGRIDAIWDVFWANGMTNPLTVVEQITYLMFIRLLDENAGDAAFDAAHQDCRWRVFRTMPPEQLYIHMGERVFPFIRNHLAEGCGVLQAHFWQDALFLVPTPRVLAKAVALLDELDLSDRDMMGDVYEYLLAQIARSGANGQFRTPRHIIRMIVEMMQPTKADSVCDPAMGTAGFLCEAARYAGANGGMPRLSGLDTDRTMVRIGAMNLLLHGAASAQAERLDALSAVNGHREEFSLILANPPFTGHLDRETAAADLLPDAPTGRTELLFLALFLRMLRVGGRCACIVPEGVLFAGSKAHRALRRTLVEDQLLEAVISLPAGVFRPYAAVSTAILIFTRTDCGSTEDVWFYDVRSDGFSLDDRRNPVQQSDIPDVVRRFRAMVGEKTRTRREQSFLVPKREIVDCGYELSFRRYCEAPGGEGQRMSSQQALRELRLLQEMIDRRLKDLEAML